MVRQDELNYVLFQDPNGWLAMSPESLLNGRGFRNGGGFECNTPRFLMPEGGFVNFSRGMSVLNFYFDAYEDGERSVKWFPNWPPKSNQDKGPFGTDPENIPLAGAWLENGIDLIPVVPKPASNEVWQFVHNFDDELCFGVWIKGPCTFSGGHFFPFARFLDGEETISHPVY